MHLASDLPDQVHDPRPPARRDVEVEFDHAVTLDCGHLRPTRPGCDRFGRLPIGEEHEVRKNFYEGPELRERFEPGASELVVDESTYYWAVRYRIAAA